MDISTLGAVEEAKVELAKDIMWVRDDLRAMLLTQATEVARLQAVVWVLTQLVAERSGVSSDDLSARIGKALDELKVARGGEAP